MAENKIVSWIKSFFKSDNKKPAQPKRTLLEAFDDENPLARMIKKIGYSLGTSNRDDFAGPEFDLTQIEDAYNTDSYIRQALDRYIELMFKAGYKIKYTNPKVKEYLEKRIIMLQDAMGQPFSHFLKEISDDLVKYSNVFMVKARKDPNKMPTVPGITVRPIGDRKPIAAYFRLPPQTMQIKTDDNGTIKKYKQVSGQNEKEFKPIDVVHIAYKRPAGKFFGVPFIIPALDDVRLLRKLEDNVAKLVYRHLYPLFIYKVGLDKPGFQATDDEIEDMRSEIQNMPIDGGLVVPERHNIDLLTTEENINADKYLEYFEKRVFTGLGVSQTIMGRADTSNRSTAENQSAEMRDKVKALQTVCQNYINHFIIRELLMEGGFDPVLNPDDNATFEFNEIDTDLEIKRENHSVYKFEHNATTFDEMREGLGLDPDIDEGRLHNNMFETTTSSADTNNRTNPQNSKDTKILDNHKYETRISSFSAELKNELKEILNSYNNNGNKERAGNEIEDLMELYLKKTGYYLELANKKAFYKGVAIASDQLDESENTPGFDPVRNRLQKDFSENSEKYSNKLKKLLENKSNQKSAINVYCTDIEKDIVGNLRETSKRHFNLGQFKTFKLNDVDNVSYAVNGSDTTINTERKIPNSAVYFHKEGG